MMNKSNFLLKIEHICTKKYITYRIFTQITLTFVLIFVSLIYNSTNMSDLILKCIVFTQKITINIKQKEKKQILANYFSNAANYDKLRKTIIAKDNYKEVIELCKR